MLGKRTSSDLSQSVGSRSTSRVGKMAAAFACVLILAGFNYVWLADYFGASLEADSSYLTLVNLALLILAEAAAVLLVWRLVASPSATLARGRRLQFSTRSLLLFMLLVCAGLVYLRYARDVERAALDAERKEQARATLDQRTTAGRLFLSGHQFTPQELEYLSTLTHLTRLDLSGSSIDDGGLRRLRPLAKLEDLALQRTAVTDEGLVHLTSLTSLRRLDLDGCEMGDAGLRHLAELADLEVLQLSNTRISDDGLVYVGRFGRLMGLALNGTRISDAGLVHLKELSHLSGLQLMGTQVKGPGLEKLARLPELTSIMLAGPLINDATVDHLAKLMNLESVYLRDSRVTASGLEQLARLDRIRFLSLARSRVTRAGLVAVKQMKNLEALVLMDIQGLTDAYLTHIAEIENLNTLALTNTPVGDAGVEHLIGMHNLVRLHLDGTNISEAAVKQLQDALPDCSIVR
jgi:Leucine-rich repeat (LRR) protein